MKHHVLQRQRFPRPVEDAADHNGVMGGIEMPQHAARRAPAPSEQRPPHQAVEELPVQAVEYLIEIVCLAAWPGKVLASANLPHQVRLAPHVAPVQVQAVAVRIQAGNGFPVEFAEQDVGQGLQHRGRSSRQQIGNTHAQPSVLQTDEAVGVGEAAKLHL